MSISSPKTAIPVVEELPVAQEPEPVKITVPVPDSKQQVELLLAQYLSMCNTNNEDELDVKNKIEDVLYDISIKQEKISVLQDKFSQSVVDKDLDLDLLKKQILALQLLSHDMNLPESLQSEFADDELDDVVEDDKLIDSIDVTDYDKMANLMGITTHKRQATSADSCSNPYVEDIISSKITTRVNQLESIPASLGSYDLQNFDNAFLSSDQIPEGFDDLKLKAIIELKSLHLLPKQKYHRRKIAEKIFKDSHNKIEFLKQYPLTMSAQRASHIRPKVFAVQTSRLAEQLEEQQKQEKSKKETRSHLQKVRKIVDFADDYFNTKEDLMLKRSNFGKSLTLLHQKIEKEESKKMESTAKQRLQALKANDEELYLKLLDQTKDTRITHLLKQTNQFLDSLANAVKEQQDESKRLDNVLPPLEEDADEEREKIDYYEVAHRIKEEVKQPSILVGGTLKEYQIKGLQWMVSLYNNHLNGILADEMGLGKTIQSISLITYLLEAKKETGKFLVIVPLSTITNWTLEFEKWAPSVNTIVYKGSPQVRKQLQHDIRIGNFTVLLTTYEYIIKDRPLLLKFRWLHMIIDEGHRMKNSKSKLSYTLTHYYHTKNRLILTGTPLQNNLPELWALLNFVLPKIFNSVKSFDEWFNTPFANTGAQDRMELTEEESLLVIRRLHKVLRPFLLRRLKKDVEKDLPDKVEKVVKCKLSALQFSLYQQMLKHNAFFIGQGTEGATKTGIKGLNNKIMQLRKVCNHPFVFEEVENAINPLRATNDTLWRSAGKFELLDRVLPKFKLSGHRVLIFFQMTQVMDIMEDYLRYKNLQYLRLDGATKADDRQDMLKLFNAPDSEYFLFLLSTRAGGLGLNLQTADTVIIFDTDWNPHQDLQAQDRAHRIGQKNEVRILRLITTDSVEEVILERAHQKLDIDGKVIQAGKFDNKSTAQEQEEFLRRLLELEQDKSKSDEEDDELEDEALNDILARSEEEKTLFLEIDAERTAKWALESKRRGKSEPIPRLMQEDELPPVFREDITNHLEQPTTDLGRTREKKRVYYDDGLTEEQWLDAMDNDDDSVELAIQRKRQRVEKRRLTILNKNREQSGELETIETPSPEPTPVKNGRGRSKSKTLDDDDEDDDIELDDDSPDYITSALELLDKLNELTDEEDGHQLTGVFQLLPSRKLYPDYYKIITKPMSLNSIGKNLKKNHYESPEEIIHDFNLIFDNAMTYNEEGSVIYDDAVKLQEFVKNWNF